jgi:nitrogen fixation protein NifZ
MRPKYAYGEAVRLIRNVRNDGTFSGSATGELLVRRGEVGHVRDVGTYLQDQLIYAVHFVRSGRVVGCREEELTDPDEPWVESRFESRERVMPECDLAVSGVIKAAAGVVGEVLRVVRESESGVAYHVRFPGHTLLVPEALLLPADGPMATGSVGLQMGSVGGEGGERGL